MQNDMPNSWKNTDKRICGVNKQSIVATKKTKQTQTTKNVQEEETQTVQFAVCLIKAEALSK